MKTGLRALLCCLMLGVAPMGFAGGGVSFSVNVGGYGGGYCRPPVVYSPPACYGYSYYGPPVVRYSYGSYAPRYYRPVPVRTYRPVVIHRVRPPVYYPGCY